MGGEEEERVWRREGRSEVRPRPKKWQPGPHFSRILSVSVYGKLQSDAHQFSN